MVQDDFKRKHSVVIHCPNCGKAIFVTEWTTAAQCECSRRLDAIDILIATATQRSVTAALPARR